ncbi:4'-phosphopantetheinyl transferase family protein [Thermoflavimicrobium dichotomicum]|uniref:Phosphopantetheinyl transferase n=1 Tax=Thermoflavimicrobium dichotomicum TaxID=46223 RepID=A0A1I3TJW4_9BACL|nr:4'-phosphopantetheinyl transferase superfamily protein [Thermoflavimicrobium dichotomicum]SFJ69916.1 Phosphopantetheinyl transferase [Thermoflavimicrobium dichotomicum]
MEVVFYRRGSRCSEEDPKTLVNGFPKLSMNKLVLKGTDENYRANMCLCYSPFLAQYLETVKYLHPKELEYYFTLKFEQRIKSYLAGRYAAKKAVSFFVRDENLDRILIEQGIFNQPIVVHPNKMNIQVSISHCDDLGVAIAFSEELAMGIDIERISIDRKDVLRTQMTDREKELIESLPYSDETTLTVFWTAKEALSKILKTGLTTPFHIYEINQIEIKNGAIFSFFKNFTQYCTVSFIFGHYICSITYPRRTELSTRTVRNLLCDIEQSIKDKEKELMNI